MSIRLNLGLELSCGIIDVTEIRRKLMLTTVQMRAKGTLVIPAALRKKYALAEGDIFTRVDLGNGTFVLASRVSIVPNLVAEIEAIRVKAGIEEE
jgi:bifunctional DNA-binding transcriptional regulator/antitoxin component of YhaV-PrlF toxin-antitoxin module